MQVKHDQKTCRIRLFARPPEFFDIVKRDRITARTPNLLKECRGFAFSQAAGFATIDGLLDGQIVAFTSYLPGYFGDLNLHLGYKLAGTNYQRGEMHCHLPCVLQKIPQSATDVLKWARSPQLRDETTLPKTILGAFSLIQ
jgi:hypothetical protein